ncbi:MAG: ATP-binding protein [Candidatus Hydrogenedentota bacterium]
MDMERERRRAEQQAKQALTDNNWPLAGYHLYRAARMSLRMAEQSSGTTREGLLRLAHAYTARGDEALQQAPASRGGSSLKTANTGEQDAEDGPNDWVLAERPEVRLADVAGMDDVKRIVEEHILLPIRHGDVYAQYALQPGAGVLMYGPPGTGKTHIARAIAGEIDAAFLPVDMKKVLSKWFGESERLLASLFEEAQTHPRSVLFFDEAEALFPKRGGTNSSVMARVVPQLLQLMQGVGATGHTMVLLGATNRPWLMDEAATRPGRFGRLVYVGLPDAEARAYMLRHAMRDTPTEDLDFEELAGLTGGYTGADIAGERDSVCVAAKMAALRRTIARLDGGTALATTVEPVCMTDFTHALEHIGPSVGPGDLKPFARFRKGLGQRAA